MARKQTKEEKRDTVLLGVSSHAQRQSPTGFIERTRASWQQRTPRALTNEDAREIAANALGFFELLARWDSESRRAEPICAPEHER